jgi:hypothetical protein
MAINCPEIWLSTVEAEEAATRGKEGGENFLLSSLLRPRVPLVLEPLGR